MSYTSCPQPRSEYISTRWYRAPECLLTSGYYGPKMDIWALGCCFYEMLTLQPLFPGENEVDQLHKIHEVLGTPTREMLERFKHLSMRVEFPKKSPINFYQIIPNLSQYGVDFLKKMLMYHPDNRAKASRLLEHVYFEDFCSKQATSTMNSLNSRLLFASKSDTTKQKSRSSSRNPSLNGSFTSSRESIYKQHENLKTDSLKRLEIMQQKYAKQLEQNWNRNSCPLKTTIIKNLNQSLINQTNVIAFNNHVRKPCYRRK